MPRDLLPFVVARRTIKQVARQGRRVANMMPTTISGAWTIDERAGRPVLLYRVREAALIVGMNPATIRRRIRRGEIRAWGRPQKVSLDDVLPIYVPEAFRK